MSLQFQAQRAVIETPILKPDTMCVSFHYHMYGDLMGALMVHVEEIQEDTTVETFVIGEIHGTHLDVWNFKKIDYQTLSRGNVLGIRFRFEAWVGGDTGDIAVDDIKIYAGCGEDPDSLLESFECDFDDGCESALNRGDKSDFSWEIGTAKTPSKNTGPDSLGDHTSGQGNYAYIEASSPRVPGDIAQYGIPPLTPSKHCLQR